MRKLWDAMSVGSSLMSFVCNENSSYLELYQHVDMREYSAGTFACISPVRKLGFVRLHTGTRGTKTIAALQQKYKVKVFPGSC